MTLEIGKIYERARFNNNVALCLALSHEYDNIYRCLMWTYDESTGNHNNSINWVEIASFSVKPYDGSTDFKLPQWFSAMIDYTIWAIKDYYSQDRKRKGIHEDNNSFQKWTENND